MRICVAANQPRPVSEVFAEKAKRPALKPLGKPCHDCAITCGFYTPISDDLAKEPADIQRGAALSWFCHNHPNRACRGVIDRLGIKP